MAYYKLAFDLQSWNEDTYKVILQSDHEMCKISGSNRAAI